jgi:hypothetical protein
MRFIYHNNANVIKILVVIIIQVFFNELSISQDDPISQELKKGKQESLGVNFSEKEAEELDHINKKYALSEKEIEARTKQRSGQKTGLMDKYRIARGNRKDYMRNKKFEKFKEKKVLSKQSEKTKDRMVQNKKKANTKYKQEKNRKKRKSFFNIFK